MPVSMYDPDGKWCPVDNVLVATRLAEGYTLEDPAVVKADMDERLAENERQVKSNEDLLAEMLGEESEPVDTVSLDEPVIEDPELEVDE